MPTVNFVNEKKQIQVPEGANLRTEARRAGIKVYHGLNGYGAALNELLHCPGLGVCGTCRVLITKGMENANRMTLREKLQFHCHPLEVFYYLSHPDTIRLACCTKVNGDMDVVTKPDLNLTGESFFS